MCEQKIHRNADLKRLYGTQSGVAHIAPTNTHQSDTHIPNTHSSNNNDIIPQAHVQHADSDSNKNKRYASVLYLKIVTITYNPSQ